MEILLNVVFFETLTLNYGKLYGLWNFLRHCCLWKNTPLLETLQIRNYFWKSSFILDSVLERRFRILFEGDRYCFRRAREKKKISNRRGTYKFTFLDPSSHNPQVYHQNHNHTIKLTQSRSECQTQRKNSLFSAVWQKVILR